MIHSLNFEHYVLTFRPTRSGEVSFLLTTVDSNKSQASKYPHRVLYIVKSKSEFLYVGEAKAELKTRFERSFVSYRHYKRNGKARGGYKGYKWIELLDPANGHPAELDVRVVLFPSFYDDKRKLVQAIEGEIVWEIRNRTNKWPRYQNEIHFNNDMTKARIIANKILNRIK